MNFRTLVMLAVAALVIVIAIKMNRNPESDEIMNPTENLSGSVIPDDSAPVDDTVMTPEEADGLVYDDMDGTVEVPADAVVPPTEDVTVGDEPVSGEEAQSLEPAVVDESPAESLEDGPAENISEEPVMPTEAPTR